jgi:uncharacterized Ntn-hydrolase superfamily protein
MPPFDVNALIAEVAARHGLFLKGNDAAFALVTMNQIVLEQTLKTAANEVDIRVRQLDSSIQKIERLAAKVLAQEVKTASETARQDVRSEVDTAVKKLRQAVLEVAGVSQRVSARWMSLGLTAALMIFLCGFIAGRWLPTLR